LNELARHLAQHPRAAIVGPHGTGKTTLLVELVKRLETDEEPPAIRGVVHWVTLQVGQPQRDLRAKLRVLRPGDLLVIDGWEQASLWLRLLSGLICWRREVRLLVTSHVSPSGFHVLIETRPNERIARQLAAELLAEHPTIAPELLANFASHWRASGGNFRELWGRLYDDFEHSIKQQESP
jgi:DNA replication protein DnaC